MADYSKYFFTQSRSGVENTGSAIRLFDDETFIRDYSYLPDVSLAVSAITDLLVYSFYSGQDSATDLDRERVVAAKKG